jgi:hypothetical protein
MKVKRKTRTRKTKNKVRSKVSRRSTKRTTYKRRNNRKNRTNRKTTKRRNRKLRGGAAGGDEANPMYKAAAGALMPATTATSGAAPPAAVRTAPAPPAAVRTAPAPAIPSAVGAASAPPVRMISPSGTSRPLAMGSGRPLTDAVMLFAKTVTGKSVIINIELSKTIGDVKQIIWEVEGIPVHQIILRKTRAGPDLSDEVTLESAGFKRGNNIFVYLRSSSTPGLTIEDAWPGWQFGDPEQMAQGTAVSVPTRRPRIEAGERAMGGLGP